MQYLNTGRFPGMALGAFLMGALLLQSARVLACSTLPGIPLGPFFYVFPLSPEPPVIKTTPENPNVLWGRVELFTGESYESYDTVSVTIDLTTGRVTPGDWEYTESPPPVLVDDPTGGYEFRVVSPNQFALVGQDGVATTYTLPDPDSIMVNPQDGVYFFVSSEWGIAYVLYESGQIVTAADGTTESVRTDDAAAYVSIDLNTNTILSSGTFDASRGLIVFRPGPFQSLETVYGLPVPTASFGALDSCGGTSWLRYTQDGAVEALSRFDPGRVQAIVDPDALIAYRLIQQDQVIFPEQAGAAEPTRYVRSFEVQQVNMVTSEVISTIPLNTEDMWALAEGVEPPFAPPPTPIIVPFPPVSNPPTPAPQTPGTGGGVLTPTNPPITVPPPTEAPINIFIARPTEPPTINVPQPTEAPINIFIARPTEPPINVFVAPPTDIPVPAPVTLPPVNGPMFGSSPTNAPIGVRFDATQPPVFPSFPPPLEQQCSSHNACSALAGDCCPTVDTVLLTCCGMGDIQLTCQENPTCNDLGLVDACCPTPTGVYLDCCTVVPDECGQSGSSCQVVSALEYRDQQQRSAESGAAMRATAAVAGISLLGVLAVL